MRFLFFALILLSSISANAQIKTEGFLRVKLGKGPTETVLLTDSLLDGEKAYFMSYSVDGRLLRKTLIDKTVFDDFIAGFERSISEARQQSLETQLTNCGQPLDLKRRKGSAGAKVEKSLCLDSATAKEQRAIGQWWRKVRTLLRL